MKSHCVFHSLKLESIVAIGLSVILCAGPLPAQDVPTFSVNVKVVNVLATVRDKQGKIVNTLTQDDFTLEEEGRPQTIKYFRRETDLPLTLGLLVDTSLSQAEVLNEERTASAGFTNDVLRADKDAAFLIQFDTEVELLQDLTKSPVKMQEALDLVHAPSYDSQRRGGGGYPGGGGGYPGGGGGYPGGGRGSGRGSRGGGAGLGTLLYDAVYLAGDEMMQKQQGRKAIVLLTDGVDHGSRKSLEQAIETAQRADMLVYSIYFTGRENSFFHGGMSGPWGGGRGGGWPGGGGGYPQPQIHENVDGKKILSKLSKDTGGRMFVVSKKENITQIYGQIQDELRSQYNIGYSPDRSPDDPQQYRHIKVAVKQRDMTVQARDGYYPAKQDQGRPGD